MADKQKNKANIKKAISELRNLYDQRMEKTYKEKKSVIRRKYRVKVTAGSKLHAAMKDYDRKKRVAHDIKYERISKTRKKERV